MTVSTTATRVTYTGDGSTTAFSAPFKFLASSDLVVILRVTATSADTPQALTTHYAVSGAGSSGGGTVTMHTPPTSAQTLIIYNDPALTQGVDYVSGDAFPAETHERALDRLTIQQQRTRDMADRTPRLVEGDTDGGGAGTYDANLNRLYRLGTPTGTSDATTKAYVDGAITDALGTSFVTGAASVTATGSTTPRTIADRWGQVFNVRDFGALGTGDVPDTTALQATLDAANTAGGGTVYLPAGDYLINAALTIGDNTCLTGEPTAWIKSSTQDIAYLTNKDTVNGNTNIRIDGLNLDLAAVADHSLADTGAVQFGNVSSLTVTGCRILNSPRHAIFLRSTVEMYEISNNYIYGSGMRPQYGPAEGVANRGSAIYAEGSRRGVIQGNRINNIWQMAVFLYGQADSQSYGVSILGNYIENCRDNSIRLQPRTQGSVDWDPSWVRSCVVSGNVIVDCAGDGVRMNGSQHSVTGNTVTAKSVAGGSGINSAGSEDCAISGNVCVSEPNERAGTDGSINNADNTFTAGTGNFTEEDISKPITVNGAAGGGGNLETTIASVNGSTSVELADAAGTTVASGGTWFFPAKLTYGIRIRPDDPNAQNQLCRRVSISGNSIRGTQGAIWLGGVGGNEVIEDINISGNFIDPTNEAFTGPGINVKGSVANRISITHNNVRTLTEEGIKVTGAGAGASMSNIQVVGNTCWDNQVTGILLNTVNGFDVSHNRCFDTRGGSALQDYGLQLEASCSNGTVLGNDFRGNDNSGISSTGTTTTQFIGNLPEGERVATLAADATPSVAGGELFLTSGTTAITDFDDGVVGQTITVKAKANITITDGGDLELAGNFAMTSGDTIRLAMLETGVWSEIGRSDNG